MRNIYTKKGRKPGKTVAIFGGVHGNERIGIDIVQELMNELNIDAGTVFLVIGNEKAIIKNKRFIEKNLNRCFLLDNNGNASEDIRARELMEILDKCDALLDIHSFSNPKGKPFAICEKQSFELAKKIDVPAISSGWCTIEPGGTDDYMYRNNKIAICLESGSFSKYNESYKRARHAVDVFLQYFGIIEQVVAENMQDKRFIHVHKAVFKKTDNFWFAKEYSNFDMLKENEIFAKDGEVEYIAKKDECIVLPTPNEPIGGEVFVLGKELF